MIKERLRGTKEELLTYLSFLSQVDGIRVLMASKPYKDRDSLYYRVYLEIELTQDTEPKKKTVCVKKGRIRGSHGYLQEKRR